MRGRPYEREGLPRRRVPRQQSKLSSFDTKSSRQNAKKGGTNMEWQFILALVIVIPVILIPVALVWFLNVSGIYAVIRDTRRRRITRQKRLRAAAEVEAK